MTMRNPYDVDMGTAGLIIQAQSRDLWDIGWLKQKNVDLPLDLIPKKITDHRRRPAEFLKLLKERKQQLRNDSVVRTDFIREMSRFLPAQIVANTVEKEPFWVYLTHLIGVECDTVIQLTPFTRLNASATSWPDASPQPRSSTEGMNAKHVAELKSCLITRWKDD